MKKQMLMWVSRAFVCNAPAGYLGVSSGFVARLVVEPGGRNTRNALSDTRSTSSHVPIVENGLEPTEILGENTAATPAISGIASALRAGASECF